MGTIPQGLPQVNLKGNNAHIRLFRFNNTRFVNTRFVIL